MIGEAERRILREKLAYFEGRVNHMYLDSKGFVTVGVGYLIPNQSAAERLPFAKVNSQRASMEEIRSEFQIIKAQRPNRVASYYRRYVTLTLSNEAIDRITDQHSDVFERELKTIYVEFETYPPKVKLALLDMIFNLGGTALRSRWPNFNPAIRSRNWALAARHSNRRPPISIARNNYVFELLTRAEQERQVPASIGVFE